MTWPTKKLGEVCEIKKGKKPILRKQPLDGDLPYLIAKFLRGTKESEYASKYDKGSVVVQKDEIIIICDGSNSGDIFIGFTGILSSTMGKIVHSKNIETEYLKLFLESNFDLFNSAKKGAAIPHLDIRRLYEIEIPLPPLETQKKIVARVEKLMAKIKEAKNLRAEAQEDTANLLPSALHKIFSGGKQKGWEEKTLEDVATIKRESNKKLLPYVGMEDIESNTGRFIGFLEPRKVKSNTFYFDQSCVLYGRLRPYLNKALIPNFEGHCSTEVFPLVPNQEILSREYLWYWITQKPFIDQAMKTTMGARMPRANMKEVMKLKISLPPLAEQKRIVVYLDFLSEKTKQIQTLQSATAADFKTLEQSILHKAFTGEPVK